MRNKIILTVQLILFAFAGSFMVSCSKNKNCDDGYYYQDFDNLKMWDPLCQVTNERAHSGEYSTYMDSTHHFSQIFEMDIASSLKKNYKSIQVTAWCMKTSIGSNVKLIAFVEAQGKELRRESLDFSSALEVPSMWINVVLFLKFPENIPGDSKIKVFGWSPQNEKAFIDDVKVEFRK